MVSAEKSVEAVMGAAEHQPDAYLLKPITEGVLLTRLNRAWQRKQVFQEIDEAYLQKDYLRAARLCSEAAAGNKLHELDLQRMRATLLLKAGEPEQARQVYEKVLQERDYNWARTGVGKIRMANGDNEAARQMFAGVIAENRFYLDAYDQLAKSLQNMGRVEESCEVLERAARMSPNSVPRQRALGTAALKLGNIALAERAFRKCLQVGEYSIMKTVDAYLGLARVLGQKNDAKEAMLLLAAVQRDFSGRQVELRTKITEGLVYHESGDYRRARKSGDELEEMLKEDSARPDTSTCLEMATLLFAVGVKDAPVELLCYVVRNNDENTVIHDEVQRIFEKARMGEEGTALINAARREASEMMNKGVLLWKSNKLDDAVAWMREARRGLPDNMRILFNSAQILISHMQARGYDEALMNEANEVLMHVDRIAPGQQRFAQLIEQLQKLIPGRMSAEEIEAELTAAMNDDHDKE
jgi:tetratricopeptide (TPR) repeat protein